jgi:hypothetical protein
MMSRTALAAVAALALAVVGCGRDQPAENIAESLDQAAEQSTPEAANVLEDAADEVREQNISDPVAADRAMQQAGNVQAPQVLPPPGNRQ